ncbi:zeste-white 10 kinetochore protein [Lycorma delicatula]|uniref:zeste-white 10 kinetochore protein n=1 Tax=Lycorma delicatula TaxID=130591 RepID=UPI003F50F985
MSLLAEVLAAAGQAEMVDINIKVSEITEKISSLKLQVMEVTENTYITFLPSFEENEDLLYKSEILSTEMCNLRAFIENQIKREVSDSTGELQKLQDTLQETEFSLSLAGKLILIHRCITEARNLQESLHFVEAAKKLKEFERLLNEDQNELKCIDIFDALEDELIKSQSNFSYSVLEKWKPCITWHETDIDINKTCKQITLHITEGNLKSELIKALHYYDFLVLEINKFGDKLLRNILFLIISKKSRVLVSQEKPQTLLIETENIKNTSCVDVISNLTIVFNFLFLNLSVDFGDRNNFIIELGESISDNFCQYFITNCLDEAVPKRQEELISYEKNIKILIKFDNLLHEIGFLPSENKQLLDYAANVDVLITNKICDCYLESARQLMKKDLHDMIEAGVNYKLLDKEKNEQRVGLVRKVKTVLQPDSDCSVCVSELSPNTYRFPLCQISKSAAELIQLVNALLDETAKSTSEHCALKLFCTARNIFKLYYDIVPLHHKKMLDTIPQQAAMLHNNFYYLAHELLMLGTMFKAKQAVALKNHIITFVDLMESLRSVGNDVLKNQLEVQKKHLLDILRDSGLVTLIENPEFPQGIEKGIRQCTRQLILLQKVWQPVLPSDAYCTSVGFLCNAFVQELIDRVCSTGDIPADTASELVRVFNIVQEKAPLVFPEPKEIYKYVTRWTKFNELVRLLGASLRDVDERWADGKGPLAQEFTVDQVKQLVKALFQISDRRAALLARIN